MTNIIWLSMARNMLSFCYSSPNNSERSSEKDGKMLDLSTEPDVIGRAVIYFPSCNVLTTTVLSCGDTNQYSLTPALSYRSNLLFSSIILLPGESISITISGAPRQPLASNLAGSQTTHISGCTTVRISLSLADFLGILTSNGAA